MHQLDDRLAAASHRSASYQGPADEAGAVTGQTDGSRSRPGLGDNPGLLAPGQAAGTLAAQIRSGQVNQAGILGESGTPVQLTSAVARQRLLALRPDGDPRTVSLPGVGDYRVVAVTEPDGDVSITGLPLAAVTSTVSRLALTITLVALAGLLVAGVVVLYVVRLSLRPLRRVATAARTVAELRLDSGEVEVPVRVPAQDTDPRTEVGQVGSALNHMIGHVESALAARQASEMKVRHFVADASHELRTPLAAIRGYAELTRPQRADSPPTVAHAMDRVESAAERMSTLVEDLLLLARLDAGRPVESEPVDLSELVVGAVSDAHAAAPDHTWQLDLPDEPVQVAGDRHQLHQVVSNLLANARTHTPPGTVVSVSLRPADDSAGRRRGDRPGQRPRDPRSVAPQCLRALRAGRQLAFAGGREQRSGPGHRVVGRGRPPRPGLPPLVPGRHPVRDLAAYAATGKGGHSGRIAALSTLVA